MRTLPLCFYTLFLCDNCCGDVDELVNSYQSKMGREHFLTMRSPTILSSVVVSQPATHKKKKTKTKKNKKLLEAHNLYIHGKRFPRKQNISPDNVFLFETLHNTQETYLFCLTRCFFFHLQAISSRPLPLFALKCDLKSKL